MISQSVGGSILLVLHCLRLVGFMRRNAIQDPV